MEEVEKMQDILSNEEIAIRLIEAWLSSDVESIDDVLYAYDAALEHLNRTIY